MSQNRYDVCIVGGLGRVGLPLGISLARHNKTVILYDIDKHAIDSVVQGKMPFKETGAETILREVLNTNLFVSDYKGVILNSYFIVIVILSLIHI